MVVCYSIYKIQTIDKAFLFEYKELMIPYYGGKQRIASWICEHIPPHTVYVEPFCGGCAVYFKKGYAPVRDHHFYREVINDSNEQLITMFRILQTNPELERRLSRTLYSSKEHEKAKKIYKDINAGVEHDAIDVAWAFFVNISMSFGAIANKGFGRATIKANHANTWYNRTNKIQQLRERLKATYIECEDALSIIDRWDSPQTCFYCDPPYPGTHLDPYKGYTIDDYQNLVERLDSIQGSFVLSSYAQGNEPEHWARIDRATKCHASGKGKTNNKDRSRELTNEELGNRKRTESLFIMLNRSPVRPQLVKHLWCPSKGFVSQNKSVELLELFPSAVGL